ncbi:hypothetical protein AN958_07456 [Leucoagaricus sp. SymC.cos]|nr:hypothetical protein AN958_07456 [Leucoagaricus sp. SymC.cos]
MINADRLHLRNRTQTGNGHIIEFDFSNVQNRHFCISISSMSTSKTINANTVLTETCSFCKVFFHQPTPRLQIDD